MNHKTILILLVCFVFFGFNKLYSQIKDIEYYNWENNCDFKTRPDRFIINNMPEFNEMSACVISKFEFNKYTIIGVQGTSPGHFKPKVDIRILQNDYDKKIIIEVTLSGGKLCETCRVNKPFYRRVIYTDKLNTDYNIEFNYTKIDE
jgi:hypothetical protein